ncbi:hypothetical protein F1B92_00535 [Campylobacter sp. FMV-PI01]|uniref:Uncharacterized protein n=1 Tax=Campylobacter portucalensis TaxID=2608384 RepID=A0A6L5WFA7_9BACT|nr:hypothetical protein [Campylobacter portucalensis]MSN95698.1 hypothetical protein [Campylobacter portucalensis]
MSDIKNPLKALEEIGVVEISKKTYIDSDYIDLIIKKDFEALYGKNVKAFIKIIEREYGLDLSFWLDEYNAHAIVDIGSNHKNFFPNSIKEELKITNKSKVPLIFFWLIFLGVIIWVLIKFELYKMINILNDENKTVQIYSTNSTAIEQAEIKLENVGIKIAPIVENNDSKEITEKDFQDIEENQTKNLNALEKTALLENSNNKKEEVVENSSDDEKSAFIKANDKIWIGVIDLKTGKKYSKNTSDKFELDLSKDQLILTGHGYFEIQQNGETKNFKDKNPHRFHIKDGKILDISYDDFLKLNKGKAW